ncbi:DUF262 domain-containing protein [uncultured Tenacibaculum sp.]|uniref:DUF262 domain-containing protein n=1 Tax=uncultured Tenacibaculum sp. TaxID=174713 RepID=UPI00261F03D1|nr:DUF262 domain-containing protein [uncultured Tenacibaculum sp.]
MANELEKAITIKNAIDKIDSGDLLLPSIQRRFVWNTKQIEFLFDSIMQDYPINTFMFWSVTDSEIKNNFRFYDFLKKYQEYKGGNNQERNTRGYKDFQAVIDGQQRLNSLYIGLKGAYAYKRYVYRKKKYKKDEEDYPSRKLFLDLLNPIINDDEKKVYDFRFLIHNEHEQQYKQKVKLVEDEEGNKCEIPCFWFEVGEVLAFEKEHHVIKYLSRNKLDIGGFAGETLLRLYKLINEKAIINFFLEKNQDFDKVLYEFIRTNSGGTTLSFADLLMSIITASWEKGKSTKGAREEIDELIRQVEEIGFIINQDFVLKTCLVLFSTDIRFALKNFQGETIQKIKSEWGKITKSIKSSFELVKSLSFNNHALRSKNAVIPIIYYVFVNDSFHELNKENKYLENKRVIKNYLHLSLLNKLFGGSSDGFLKSIKQVLDENSESIFPLIRLKERFKGTNRSFIMDDEKIESVLRTSYDSLDSFYVLSLLFPKFNFEFKNPNIDHLHPKSQFENSDFNFLANQKDIDFYRDYWNTTLNLALLSEEQNKSKNKRELDIWIKEQEKTNKGIRNSLLIPELVGLSFENFKKFIQKREEVLKEIIKENIGQKQKKTH